MVKVYVLKSKDGVASAFANYKTFVENQTGRKIKCVRTDNAPEYVGGEFAKILQESGIMHQRSVAFSPQQNGIAERMNRTLVEMTRCMLDDAGLPDKWWAEALQTAVYIRNRVESRAVNNTSFETFWGIKPNMKHVRAFGSPAVALKKGGNRSKLDRKGVECRLIGYSSHHKGYRMLCPDGKIIISRSVRFLNEDGSEDNEQMISVDESEIQGQSSGVQSEIRRNPGRACKAEPISTHQPNFRRKNQTVKVNKEEEESLVDTEQGGANDNELTAPTFRIGAGTSINTPKNFEEASSGPWSKFW